MGSISYSTGKVSQICQLKVHYVSATGKVLQICQLKICMSYRKSVVNLLAQGIYQQHNKCMDLSAQGMVSNLSVQSAAHQTQCCGKLKVCISYRKSIANLSAHCMYQLQKKCRESVSASMVSDVV
jgi:hypothetical protein